jgi:glycosyltransferase involved in cell wall biosynthesis
MIDQVPPSIANQLADLATEVKRISDALAALAQPSLGETTATAPAKSLRVGAAPESASNGSEKGRRAAPTPDSADQGPPVRGPIDLAATLARIEMAQAALQKQVAALQDHSNLVGYLVEQVVARTNPFAASKSARALRFVGKRLKAVYAVGAPFVQLALHPGISIAAIKRTCVQAVRRSRRSHWLAGEGKWKQELNVAIFIENLSSRFGKFLSRRNQKLYSVSQRLPTVPGRRPRVMHVIPNVFVGGSTQLVVDLHDYLGHKYEMQVVTSAFPDGVHKGMMIHDLRQPTSFEAFADLFGKFEPDLLHVHYWGDTDWPWYDKAFAAASFQKNCRIIENVNTPVTPYFHKLVDRYVFVSDYVRDTFGRGSTQDVTIYPGIDLSKFTVPNAFDPRALDSIGMVYRLEPDKLDPHSIEPLIQTVVARPKTRVFVIGDGSLFDVFYDRVTEAGVRDNFVFTGYVPYARLPEYYSQFRTFVAPVWQESFGQVTPFAMSMGLAVAGNKVGALPEILGGDETLGDTVEETAAKLRALLDNPARIAELGERNRKRAQENFDVKEMCRRYDRLYEEALGLVDSMPGFPPAEIFLAS